MKIEVGDVAFGKYENCCIFISEHHYLFFDSSSLDRFELSGKYAIHANKASWISWGWTFL